MFQAVVDVGLWIWMTSMVSSAFASILAWIGDFPAVVIYLAALDSFAITVITLNGVQEIRKRKQNVLVGPPPLLSPPVSSQNAADVKQIAFFFEDYAKPAREIAQRVTNRLWDRIRDSDDKRDWALAQMSKEYGFKPCDLASAALNFELIGPDKENVKLLQQRLREFFLSYQMLVQWTNRLAPLFYPLKEDPEYNAWQEKHNLFYNELKKLTRADGLSDLRRELQHGRWYDIMG